MKNIGYILENLVRLAEITRTVFDFDTEILERLHVRLISAGSFGDHSVELH